MFQPEEIAIYTYFDGVEVRWVDPIEVQINLESHDPDFAKNFKILFDLVQESHDADAAKEIVRLGRIMFKLPEPRWDAEQQKVVGLTTLGVMRVILDYINWSLELKKNIEDTPTSVPSTDSGQNQPTNVSADSGLTSIEK
jgi:hypothetical protein